MEVRIISVKRATLLGENSNRIPQKFRKAVAHNFAVAHSEISQDKDTQATQTTVDICCLDGQGDLINAERVKVGDTGNGTPKCRLK
jgi:hypothetical protein